MLLACAKFCPKQCDVAPFAAKQELGYIEGGREVGSLCSGVVWYGENVGPNRLHRTKRDRHETGTGFVRREREREIPWIALPEAGMYASTVVVKNPPYKTIEIRCLVW
jgi:hypothetical protein